MVSETLEKKEGQCYLSFSRAFRHAEVVARAETSLCIVLHSKSFGRFSLFMCFQPLIDLLAANPTLVCGFLYFVPSSG